MQYSELNSIVVAANDSICSNGMYDCVKFHFCVSIKDDMGNLVGRTPPFNLGTGTEVAHAFFNFLSMDL